MPEIRIAVKEDFDKRIEEISNKLGLSKSEFIKGIIAQDLKWWIK